MRNGRLKREEEGEKENGKGKLRSVKERGE